MLPLDDPRWQTYRGGYKVLYDATPLLRRLVADDVDDEFWQDLWEDLFHQNDVDTASYAAVPYLLEYIRRSERLDWNPFSLIAAIELERRHNPPLPDEIAEDYLDVFKRLPEVIGAHPQLVWDETLTRSIVACLALARGQPLLARAYLEMNEEAAEKWLTEEIGYDRESWAGD